MLPEDFLIDVRKAFNAGDAVLVLRVDETDAFKARELLDEETRSLWTISTPPTPQQVGAPDVRAPISCPHVGRPQTARELTKQRLSLREFCGRPVPDHHRRR